MDPILGSIMLFAGTFAPQGWAFCNGQLLSISQYSALFSLLGTTYGGDGVRTFALPDLRGRVPVHPGQSVYGQNYVPGQTGGNATTTLSVQNMPPHNHLLMGDTTAGGKEFPGPHHVLGPSITEKMYSVNPPNANFNPQSISVVGGGLPFDNMQPFQCINYCIALQGIYPSRN